MSQQHISLSSSIPAVFDTTHGSPIPGKRVGILSPATARSTQSTRSWPKLLSQQHISLSSSRSIPAVFDTTHVSPIPGKQVRVLSPPPPARARDHGTTIGCNSLVSAGKQPSSSTTADDTSTYARSLAVPLTAPLAAVPLVAPLARRCDPRRCASLAAPLSL